MLNFVATADWAVGIFPHIFEQLPFRQDLGGAGYKGFNDLEKKDNPSNQSSNFIYETNQDGTIHQLKYITGDHGAALKEENWDLIANFIVNGTVSFEKEIFPLEEVIEDNQTQELSKQKLWKNDVDTKIKIVSEFPLITWLFLLTIIISIGFIAYFIIFNLLAISILAKTVLITIFIIFYLFVLYMFLTRF